MARLQPGVHGNPDFPFACPAGTVGDDPTLQANALCARICPAGYWCGSNTIVPTLCEIGTYCTEGSPVPNVCPAGTYGPRAGLTTRSDCVDCPPGSSCAAGSASSQSCPLGTRAPNARSPECEPCPQGTYQDELGSSQCKACPPGRFCPAGSVNAASVCRPCSNATLATAHLEPGTWRLGPSTERIYPCLKVGDTTPCRGGGEAGTLGGGYCVDGNEGPLCEVCSNASTYFSRGEAACKECPDYSLLTATSFLAALGAAAALLVVAIVVTRVPCARRLFSRVYAR